MERSCTPKKEREIKIMRAILMNAPGDPDVLKIADIPKPKIVDPSGVLVKLHAAGVNPIDAKVRKLNMYYPDKLPLILGCDGAGVVESIGSSVIGAPRGNTHQPGQAVKLAPKLRSATRSRLIWA